MNCKSEKMAYFILIYIEYCARNVPLDGIQYILRRNSLGNLFQSWATTLNSFGRQTPFPSKDENGGDDDDADDDDDDDDGDDNSALSAACTFRSHSLPWDWHISYDDLP